MQRKRAPVTHLRRVHDGLPHTERVRTQRICPFLLPSFQGCVDAEIAKQLSSYSAQTHALLILHSYSISLLFLEIFSPLLTQLGFLIKSLGFPSITIQFRF